MVSRTNSERAGTTMHTAAFTLQPGALATLNMLPGLYFPPDWYPVLREVQAAATGRPVERVTPPVNSLNAVLRALIPHLVVLPRPLRDLAGGRSGRANGGGAAQEVVPWLLARDEVPPRTLWMIVQAWIEQTYRKAAEADVNDFRALLSDARSALRPEDLQWRSLSTPLLRAETSTNGTARPAPAAYAAIPTLLAERAIARGLRINVGGSPSSLAWAPGRDGGVELMSWPPTAHTDKRGKYFYSYVVALTLQTLPGVADPRIHAHYSVRRWRSAPVLESDGQTRIPARWFSAYLRPIDGWLGLQRSDAFAVAEFGAIYTASAADGATQRRVPGWRDAVPEIAARLGVPFPAAEAYAAEPALWLSGAQRIELATVEMWPESHGVGAGVGADEVEALTGALAGALGELVVPVPELLRLPRRNLVAAHPLQEHLQDLPAQLRLAGLRDSVLDGSATDITVEVWWSTETMRDLLVERVQAQLCGSRPPLVDGEDAEEDDDGDDSGEDERDGAVASVGRRPVPRVRQALPPPEPAVTPVELALAGESDAGSNGFGPRLLIVPRSLGALGEPLAPPDEGKFLTRTLARAGQVAEVSPTVGGPTLALVELPDYRDSSPALRAMRARFRQRDPKLALRLGLARAGRVSQFVAPPSAEDLVAGASLTDSRLRAGNAILDGLRQLGFLPAPIGFRMASAHQQLPDDLLVAAVRILRVTRKRSLMRATIPVVTLFHTESQSVQAWLPDGAVPPVRSYRQALLDLANFDPALIATPQARRQLEERLATFLLHGLPNLGARNAAILVEAQNARGNWTGITNEQLGFDAVRYPGSDQATSVVGARGNVRLIRLRTANRGETPEWYMEGARPGMSAAGLWYDRSVSHVFYGTADKPRGMKGGRLGKQEHPREQHAIASLLEIVPAAVQPQDRDEDGVASLWAHAVEQWRRMGYLMPKREMTLLPLPLHVAEKMDEYVRVIAARSFPEDEDVNDGEEDEDEDEA